MLDFRVPVSYSRTIIVFVGIRYKHLRVQTSVASPYIPELYAVPRPVSGLRSPLASGSVLDLTLTSPDTEYGGQSNTPSQVLSKPEGRSQYDAI